MASTPHSGLRSHIEDAFGEVSALFKASMGPVNARYPYQPSNEPPQANGSFLGDLGSIEFDDVRTLLHTFYDKTKGVQDDNDLLLERLVSGLSRLPANSKLAKNLTDGFVETLWDALPHPPVSSLGKQYRFREADGYNNNIMNPTLGQAGQPYSRSARPEILQNAQLPDPADIFDELMDRGDTFEEHPNKISSMLFYLASIITHDIFQTSHEDPCISNASSYLDLAPLYGHNMEQQSQIRTFKDGKLKPDCFSEKRLLGLPPGVGVLLIMFNRFHNSTATTLALVNENGRFNRPTDDNPDKWAAYDHELFNTARLVTGGLYVNIILKDYVSTILSTNRTKSTWSLDPRSVITKTALNSPPPEATGNSVSAEFNLIYRWHSAISQRDGEWIQQQYERIFPGEDPQKMDLRALLQGLGKMSKAMPEDPLQRPYVGLERKEDGTFPNADLVEILTSSVEDVAGSFGANKVPTIMRSVEILSIMQARQWNLASLNEFRAFFGITPHKTFEDINPDPAVAQKLKNLYDSPDFVELYPGLVAEKAKPVCRPGSGLCVNYTTSRAILSDAVSLVRGDRFYTTDFNGKSLTNWGFTQCGSDPKIDQGHVMYKLILGAFPDMFAGNSIYAHFPFTTPSENLVIHESLGTADMYSWVKPEQKPGLRSIDSYDAVTKVLADKANWKVTWTESIECLVAQPERNYGKDYCLAGDAQANESSRKLVMSGLYPGGWTKQVEDFYTQTTEDLFKKYSCRIAGSNCIDIVRDVSVLAHTHFSAELCSLPLKTEASPHGIYTEQELSQVLSVAFFAIFYDVDPVKSMPLRQAAQALSHTLGKLLLLNVESVAYTGFITSLFSKMRQAPEGMAAYSTHMILRMLDSKLPVKDIVWGQLLPTATSMVVNQTQLFAQVLDFYLVDGVEHLPALQEAAKQDTEEADDLLLHYFMEAARLRHTVGLFREAATNLSVDDNGKRVDIPKGHRVLVNLVRASHDESAFPEPHKVRTDRPLDAYLHYGHGPHLCAGMDASKVALVTMLKAVLKLPGLRLDPRNPKGLTRVPGPFGYEHYMKADGSSMWPLPTTLKIRWDVDEDPDWEKVN